MIRPASRGAKSARVQELPPRAACSPMLEPIQEGPLSAWMQQDPSGGHLRVQIWHVSEGTGKVESKRSAIGAGLEDTRPVLWSEAVELLRSDGGSMRMLLAKVFRAVPYDAFFWECPPLSLATAAKTRFEFVVLPAPGLEAARADPKPFAEHLEAYQGQAVARTFENLGGTAVLVAPAMARKQDLAAYVHIARFFREGPEAQQIALLRELGEAISGMLQIVGERTNVWVSTHGLGVFWLHMRLDLKPKYYQHRPYKNFKCGAGDEPAQQVDQQHSRASICRASGKPAQPSQQVDQEHSRTPTCRAHGKMAQQVAQQSSKFPNIRPGSELAQQADQQRSGMPTCRASGKLAKQSSPQGAEAPPEVRSRRRSASDAVVSQTGEIRGVGQAPQGFQVRSFHVSCESDRPKVTGNYFGIVLYKKGGATEWTSNGVCVRAGYIYITDESCVRDFPREAGGGHGAAYRRLFGRAKPADVIASGFAIRAGVWDFDSSFNTGHAYADDSPSMNEHEQHFVHSAVSEWMRTRKQNWEVPQSV